MQETIMDAYRGLAAAEKEGGGPRRVLFGWREAGKAG